MAEPLGTPDKHRSFTLTRRQYYTEAGINKANGCVLGVSLHH
jgi:hypothetical protein